MPSAERQPAFPLFGATAALTGAAVVMGGLAWTLTPRFFGDASLDDAQVASAALMASVLVWAATVATLLPLAILGPRGVMPTVFAYFAGVGARVIACLGGALVLIVGAGKPADAVLISLVAVYLPLMFIEVAIVGRYLWAKDASFRLAGHAGFSEALA